MKRLISERSLVVVLFITAFTVFALAQQDMKRSRLLPQAGGPKSTEKTPGAERATGKPLVIAAQS